MNDLPTLEAAMKLADQDSPLPSLAGPALKVLRARIRYLALQRLGAERFAREEEADSAPESATLTALIAELRSREDVGRQKYGTDVDRTDLTNADWRQHLREELMDALLYSLAEERTQPQGIIFMDGDSVRMPSVLTPAMEYDWFNLPPNMAATASNRYRNMRDGLARRSNTSIKGSPHA